MKKYILPMLVLAASGGYVWSQQGRLADPGIGLETTSLDAGLGTAPLPIPKTIAPAAAAPQPAEALVAPAAPAEPQPADVHVAPAAPIASAAPRLPAATVAEGIIISTPAPAPEPVAVAVTAPVPLPRPRPAPPAQTQILLASASTGAFKDGSYRGPAANAYYGLVQVQAVVQNGQLVQVKILQYPSDRRTSRYINSQALPLLQQEAIQAQSGRVDYVSGATLSSNAFVQSLSGALSQAAL